MNIIINFDRLVSYLKDCSERELVVMEDFLDKVVDMKSSIISDIREERERELMTIIDRSQLKLFGEAETNKKVHE